MPNLVNYTPIPIAQLVNNIQLYKYNPSAIQRVILDNLYLYTSGQADIVDPTNPFTFLLEASCVNTSVAVQESLINLQKQYSALAQNFNDLYLHMSDLDYLNTFATPATTKFTWTINYNELLNNLVFNPATGNKQITIPRNTTFTVNNLVFSIQYPINIIQYVNGSIQVMYDTAVSSPLQQLSTNIIPYKVIQDNTMVQWLSFTIDAMQFSIASNSFPVQASNILHEAIPFTGQYYFARAYFQNTATGTAWKEMITTYTEQVYDPQNPTLSLSVDATNGILNVFLPPIYVDTGLVSGTVRVDLYTTNGLITVNLSNYVITAFQTNLIAVDTVNDLNIFTAAMAGVSYIASSSEIVQGGRNSLTFAALRQQVINNTVGMRNIPITSVQLADQVNMLGFNIIKNVDYITDRVFQATQILPAPSNPTLITPAALSLNTLVTTLSELTSSSEVINNVTQTTILSNTLFIENNGILKIYPDSDRIALMANSVANIAQVVNANNFLYNPFYYVLDYSNVEFSLRAYDLDSPSVSSINFIYQNQTLQLSVNTSNIQINKTATGYSLIVTTASGSFYQALADSFVQIQLAYMPQGETNYAYINGTLIGKTTGGERIFKFSIDTNYFIDSNDNINIINANMFNTSYVDLATSLKQNCYIFYTTTSISTGYVRSTADNLIGNFLLPSNAAVITQEEITITFGEALASLWTRSLVNQIGGVYKTYTSSVPATYESTVYANDPTTGSIFSITAAGGVNWTVQHNAGDPMLDTNGNQIYIHNVGDVVYDASGNPIVDSALSTQYSCDLLLVDGSYLFATDPSYVAYRSELRSVLNLWITESLASISGTLLEQTNIYYYPQKSLSTVAVKLNNTTTTTIAAAQVITVNLYVSNDTYNNAILRNTLYIQTIYTVNKALAEPIVSISNIMSMLKAVYGTSAISFNVSGIGGANNYDTVTLLNNNESLSLAKVLEVQSDGTTIVSEDVVVNFIKYSN